jgi:hypothetical protein
MVHPKIITIGYQRCMATWPRRWSKIAPQLGPIQNTPAALNFGGTSNEFQIPAAADRRIFAAPSSIAEGGAPFAQANPSMAIFSACRRASS